MKMCDEDRFRTADGKIGGVHLTHKTCTGIEKKNAFTYDHCRGRTGRMRIGIRCPGAEKNYFSLRSLRANWLRSGRE